MSSLPIASAFNDGYVAEMYERFRADPSAVEESWRQFFRFAERLSGLAGAPAGGAADAAFLRKVAGAAMLVDAIRSYGHLAVQLDPLGGPAIGAAELTPAFHGITEDDLAGVPAEALGFARGTAADVVARLRNLYSGRIGYEFEYIEEEAEREWFRRAIEQGEGRRELTPDEKLAILRRLTEVDGLERFLHRAYVGNKRFSIEGTDVMVPMIDTAIERAVAAGAEHVVVGMAHRGRLNVLAHILDKPYATIFEEFEGKHAQTNAASDTGDVKYHLGAHAVRAMPGGEQVEIMLVPNPSHLEFVNPVLEGIARALQRVAGGEPGARDESRVLPLLIHGDAAFPGEGVVAETLNLSHLNGYRTGGTLHIIANNQIGFTTDPRDGRSTYYASDLAKGFEIPVVHVNADDAESCIAAVWLAVAYRERFGKDFVIDLVGYRRHGHNEGDEPTYTQPTMYERIRTHRRPNELWAERLVAEQLIGGDEARDIETAVQRELQQVYDDLKSGAIHPPEHLPGDQSAASPPGQIDTRVRADQLVALNDRLLSWPDAFQPHPKLARQLERRRGTLGDAGGIDWGQAEALAFASLLVEGISVRLSGQDAVRGTFSHRHAVLHDVRSGEGYVPLRHLPSAGGWFEIYNSPLSETAVLGFEYGYSVAATDTLVLWEAQFGDFANVAQPIIDQFILADRAKWGQNSGVVLLLPHGYEGQGPEHSSARLERFLTLSAEGNVRVAYPSNPAQYFHILRRQGKLAERRPLVLMQPKSLLRLERAAAKLADLANGRFDCVIDDPDAARRREAVRRLVFCTGKIYYDLSAKESRAHVALVRIEELYPFPHDEVARILDRYPVVEEVVWAQEEPKNMGAWSFVAPRLHAAVGNALPIRYIGRPERASPAEGYLSSHQEHQARIVADVLEPAGEKPKRRAVRA